MELLPLRPAIDLARPGPFSFKGMHRCDHRRGRARWSEQVFPGLGRYLPSNAAVQHYPSNILLLTGDMCKILPRGRDPPSDAERNYLLRDRSPYR